MQMVGGRDGGGGKPRCHLLSSHDGPNVGRGRKRTRDSLAAQFDSVAATNKEGSSGAAKMNNATNNGPAAVTAVNDNKENESLVTSAAVVLKKNKYGESALHIAVKKGDLGKVRTLIQGRYSVTFCPMTIIGHFKLSYWLASLKRFEVNPSTCTEV